MGHKEPSGGGLMARKEAIKWRRPPLVVIACDTTRPIRTAAPTLLTPRSEATEAEAPPTTRPPGQVSDAG